MRQRTNLNGFWVMSLVMLGMMCTCAAGGTLYVDVGATGSNNGSSWSDAYVTLQDGLGAAVSGDEIRVAQGTYTPDQGVGVTPGAREATFQLKSGVAVRGGYAGNSEDDPDVRDIEEYETILSGDLNGDDGADFQNNGENSYHVITGSGADQTGVVEGVTIGGGERKWGRCS